MSRNSMIHELPPAEALPGPGELVVPVFAIGTNHALRRIPIADLCRLIVETVNESGAVSASITDSGLIFSRTSQG